MIRHYVLTLDGNAQQLSSVLPRGGDDPGNHPIRTISLQPAGGNANAVFVGSSGVTSSDFGVRLEPGNASIPPAPFILGEFAAGWARLSDFWVIGTNTQKLHLLVDHYV